MKNTISYYYNIYIDDLIKNNNEYYFYLNNHEYHFVIYDRPLDEVNYLYELNEEMVKRNILVHKIIKNINNGVITFVDGINYILIELCDYKNDKVLLNDIKYYQNFTMNLNYNKILLRNDWINLWCNKIDYYEYQISQFGKKYPILCDSLSYYIGLGENAISYLANNMKKYNIDSRVVVSHKRVRINDGSFEFYNPINFVVDSRIRDFCEYIKNTFFNNELNLFEIKSFIDKSYFTNYEYILLFSRLLFPTYYFDIYDEIINNNLDERIILKITDKNKDYENFLNEIYKYIVQEKNIFIEPIEWLIRRY